MATNLERELTAQFYRFELLGRGGQVCPVPIAIEPPFRPFPGYRASPPRRGDDGRRHTLISGLIERLGRAAAEEPEGTAPEPDEDPGPAPWERREVAEFLLSLPRDPKAMAGRMEHLLGSLALCREPVSFEVWSAGGRPLVQLAVGGADALRVESRLSGLFPEGGVAAAEDNLSEAWRETGASFAVCECGLEREFMLPLTLSRLDPYLPLLSSLASLEEQELGVMQVIFRPVEHAWGREALRAVSDGDGGPFFANRPELLSEARAKFARPLYAVVVRFASSAEDSERAWEIVAEMASGFVADGGVSGNRLIPLSNDGYDAADHERDLILRQSRRLGMLLNQDELLWLAHIPTDPTAASLLRADGRATRGAPKSAQEPTPLLLGYNQHGGRTAPVFLSDEGRFRHTHVIGASGTGKSTLLFSMIRQDVENGAGVAVLDPHGDLIAKVLGVIPEGRIRDVVVIDPADEEYVVGFNILSAHSDLEKALLASDLVSIFARLSTSWGDQMNSVFQNAILAFLESTRGGTLSDLRRFLLDKDFRAAFLRTVTDPEAVFYWEKAFPQLGGNKSIGPILTRLESFLSPKPIRRMVSERSNSLDFADIMNSGKILLAPLSQGRIGRENSHLLGSLLVAKFQQTAMARQAMPEGERRPFWLYVDEFQNFATPSMAEILSGARKYRLGLTLAHQDLAQIRRHPDIGSAVLTNTHTRVVFRPSDEDAQALSAGFAHFDAGALTGLPTGEALCRIGGSGEDFNLSVPPPSDDAATDSDHRRLAVIERSRRLFGRKREEIVAESQDSLPQAAKPAQTPNHPPVVRPEEPATKPVPHQATPLSVPTPTRRAKPEVPAVLGIGGEVHTKTQRELKQVAESLGFRATIEKQLPGTLESSDLLLERDGFSIAVEVTITNSLDYELKNIGKCLRAGVSVVAVVAVDQEKLRKLEAAALSSFGEANAPRLRFFTQAEICAWLQTVASPSAAKGASGTTRHKGWKVKTTTVHLAQEEMKALEQETARVLAESLRKKPAP